MIPAELSSLNRKRSKCAGKTENSRGPRKLRRFQDLYSRLAYTAALLTGFGQSEAEALTQEASISIAKKISQSKDDQALERSENGFFIRLSGQLQITIKNSRN
jgi:hypothetical protein